ncbi:protein SHQ1 homolog [Bombina bombina]|uniref:protein SHQ1 homolog n=1 Tax=Bombina bombina TaxID=8345 RepID=UPI00235AF759|nr:protein SHQ1 homolog [Bombina bombina]XP_053576863.1 protein SHQ1 homolog [Bombina bombina]
MITPAFELVQDEDFLTINIRIPYAKVSEIDVYIEGDDFKFYAKPYFLRLTLPGRIVEDGRQKANYNSDNGTFTIRVPKETPGQNFEGLNLLTSLLAPKGKRSTKSLIEEIGSPDGAEEEEEDEFDWQIEQTPFEDATDDVLNSQCTYGFGNSQKGVFNRLQEELNDIIDLRDPDTTAPSERTKRRLAAENEKFNPDHYLADFFEDDTIRHLLKYKPWWVVELSGMSFSATDSLENKVTFNDKEKEQLRKLTNKSYLLDKKTQHLVYLGLIDLLLAYCYEIRVTEGERNVESAWNIRKLSGTLSWFENYTCIKDVLVSFGRRVVCYPLYRHFSLVTKAVKDMVAAFRMGKAAVLKCLLDIHSIFQENDPAYILNELYITDYCVWIQRVKSKKLSCLCESLQAANISKSDLGFELEELEEAGLLVQEEEKTDTTLDTVPRQPPALIASSSDFSPDTGESSPDESTSSEHTSSEDSSDEHEGKEAMPLIEELRLEQNADAGTEINENTMVLESDHLKEFVNTDISSGQDAASKHFQSDQETTEQPTERSPGKGTNRELLEVTSHKNLLLFVEPSEDNQ